MMQPETVSHLIVIRNIVCLAFWPVVIGVCLWKGRHHDWY